MIDKIKKDLPENGDDELVCEACGGALKEEKINLEEFEGGKHYHMENIPAYVCLMCGETWIPQGTIREFETMIAITKNRKKTFNPPSTNQPHSTPVVKMSFSKHHQPHPTAPSREAAPKKHKPKKK